MKRKVFALVAGVVLLSGVGACAAPAEAATVSSKAVAAGPCTGRSLPSIFKPLGYPAFFWWFATGCKG